jgi:hypothetical protein
VPIVLLLVLAQASAVGSAGSAPARMLFGFAKRTITPAVADKPVYLAGFGHDRRATGVHDDLWARAVAVSDGRQRVAIVAVDLIGLFHDDVLKAREELERSVPGAVLIVASTHDHQGPDTQGLWGKGRFSSGVDSAYVERVRRTVVEAAREALGRLVPGRLVLGRTRMPGLIEDGRLPRVIDDTLMAMQAIGEDGATLGTVIDWSSHPEALGRGNTLVTSDYPHYLRARIEERLGGTCVFLVGSIGGLMTPLGVKLSGPDGTPVRPESFAHAQAVGERAADAALDALTTGRPTVSSTLEHRSATVFVPLENRLFRLAAFLGVLDRRLFSGGQPATTLFGDDLRTEVGYVRIGDVEALLVPGEIYPELVVGGIQDPQDPRADFQGAPRERPLFSLLSSDYRMVIGLANDAIGYIIPRSEWDTKPPFAYGLSEAQYGEVNSCGPSVAARLVDAFAQMLER